MNQILSDVLYAVAAIGGLGLLFGAGLGYAGKRFAVREDETVSLIRGLLPGVNCGGCGYAGCDELAKAMASGEADNNACPVGGASLAAQIAEALGQEVTRTRRVAAYVKCSGDDASAETRYEYDGLDDCRAVLMLSGGGPKSCKYGCLGLGSCSNVCQYGAISRRNGVAVIDPGACAACGMCVKVCPRGLIEMVPVDSAVRVSCNSRDGGKTVREHCGVGCIACKLCEKACGYDAVRVRDMLAHIDYDKCAMCGECAAKCPTKAIEDAFAAVDHARY